jgi:hypothetical protein
MSVQNEMRRTQKTNLEFKAKRLRGEIDSLCRLIQINLDCSLKTPEELPVSEIDAQWDELKSKWADLSVANAEIARLESELT